jgi:hypothetical protein
MASRNPAHRFLAVKNETVAPEHPHERGLWLAMNRGQAEDHITRALELYVEDEREIMQAWLIAGATNEHIREYLGLAEEVTEAYRHLFFDMRVFRDQLDIIKWVREYTANQSETESAILQNALVMGVPYLMWVYGRGETTLAPEVVQRQVMADAYFRGRSGRMHTMTSKEAQVAHQYMSTAFKASQVLGEKNTGDINQILIKLRYRDMTEPVTEAVKNEEILH